MGVDEENLLVLGVFVLGQLGGLECQVFVEMPIPCLDGFRSTCGVLGLGGMDCFMVGQYSFMRVSQQGNG